MASQLSMLRPGIKSIRIEIFACLDSDQVSNGIKPLPEPMLSLDQRPFPPPPPPPPPPLPPPPSHSPPPPPPRTGDKPLSEAMMVCFTGAYMLTWPQWVNKNCNTSSIEGLLMIHLINRTTSVYVLSHTYHMFGIMYTNVFSLKRLHWKSRVVMMPILMSLVAPQCVDMTTYGATNNEITKLWRFSIVHVLIWSSRVKYKR